MDSEIRPIGVDEQVQSALVAAQLDFGRAQEIHRVLVEIREEVEKLSTLQSHGSSRKSFRRSVGGSQATIDELVEDNMKLATEVSRLAAVVSELLDDRNFSSVARVRALQNSIMDRLAVVDALVAKVTALEKSSRNI